jgi:RimJ/RimL family protein N-acetyltransferase
MIVETGRLLLRPIQDTDVTVLATLWTDPEVTRFMGGPRDYQEIHEILLGDVHAEPKPELDLWPVVEKATHRVIGHCGILDKDVDCKNEFELTYVLKKSVGGEGYATEIAICIKDYAFRHLGLNRIIALIDPMNPASARVATKVGMQYEKDTIRQTGKTMQIFALNNDG